MGSRQAMTSPAETSKTSQAHSDLIKKWLMVFGEVYGKEVTTSLTRIWFAALSGVESSALNRACEKTSKESRFFPTPAEVLSHIKNANEVLSDLEAEKDWQKSLRYAQDLGCDYAIESAKGPNDPVLEAAVRAAGGWRWIAGCCTEELQWAKKKFIEIWKKHKAAPELYALCSKPLDLKMLLDSDHPLESDEDAAIFERAMGQQTEDKVLPDGER